MANICFAVSVILNFNTDSAAGAGRPLRLGLEFNCSCMCYKVTFGEDLDADLPGRFFSAEKAVLEQ